MKTGRLSRFSRECIAILMTLCLLLTSFQYVFAADNIQTDIAGDVNSFITESAILSDLRGHWAEEQVLNWLDSGRIQGYPDGTFQPDNAITRGEFFALVNRSFGFQQTVPISFTDLQDSDWEYQEVAKAVKAGYVEGYPDGTIGAKLQISRLEAAVIIARLLKKGDQVDSELITTFSDYEQIAEWGQSAVAAAVAEQIMNGYGDFSFRPAIPITRAETVVTLDRTLAPRTYEKAGIYGPAGGNELVTKDVVINTAGITLQNMTITGNLLLEEGIGEGDVTLNNVTVQGLTTVNGGGKNSIHFNDSVLATVIVDKRDGTVRVVVEGSTTIAKLVVLSSVIIEAMDSKGGGIAEVWISEELPADATIELNGNIEAVNVLAKSLNVTIPHGTIKRMHVYEQATDVTLNIGDEAVVIVLIIDAVIKVFGQGTIESATISGKAQASTFEKQPLKKDGAGASSSEKDSPGYDPSETPDPDGTPSPTPTASPDLRIIENGQTQAVIVIEQDATARVSAAADTLAEYVHKSTGAALPILTTSELAAAGSQYNGDIRIYVGTQDSEAQTAVAGALEGLNEDGFVIFPYEQTVSIIGPTDWGTTFGVNKFLEHYFGIRWLMPGLDGEDVPQHISMDIPHEMIREEPATISRSFFYLITPTNAEWGRRNGIHDNIQFHHNLAVLFDPTDPELMNHPEYYVDGELPSHEYEWQPCFNDTTAAVAIQRIQDYFAANPDAGSYSLGINDSEKYCEADKLLAGGKLNANGSLNMSDVYYPWVNKVVEGVVANELYKDKYFGLLAYWTVYEPPTTVQLHPQVVPYITDDRMSWLDSDFADEGTELTEAWEDAAANLGWYEYLYGTPYNVPRVYPQKMAENYKYAQEHGVIGHVAELFPNFGEGPKPWVSAKLQWNADQDVDALLNEWYTRAVGAAAAVDLKAYYELWENFWSVRILESEWYERWKESDPRSNFMRFDQPDYLEAVTKEDITESRRLLKQVVLKAQAGKQKARAEALLRAFEFYEASALSYPRTTAVAAPMNQAEALTMLEDIEISFEMVKKRFVLPTQFEGDPILDLPLAPPKSGGTWDGIQTALIDALQSYVNTHPEDILVSEGLSEFLDLIGFTNFSANAIKTTASKTQILQSLDFNEGPWKDAEPFSDFMVMGTRIDVPEETKVYLLWDDVNLYVGYENFDSNPAGMIVSNSLKTNWWSSGADDSVETYVAADPDVSFKGFFSNPKDVKFSYKKIGTEGPAPNPGEVWETNSIMKSDRWNTVQVIPFANIGVDPNETTELQGFFLRNYHGQKWFLGWGGGFPWKQESFKPIHLIQPDNLVQDASFETGEPDDSSLSSQWWFWGANPEAPGMRTTEIKRTGSYSFVAGGGTSQAGLVQNVPITRGSHKATLYYYVPQDSNTLGAIQFWGAIMDGVGGTTLATSISSAMLVSSAHNGQWVKFEYEFDIQADYQGVEPHNLNVTIVLYDFGTGEKLYLDDIAIHKLPDYSLQAQSGTVNVVFNSTFLQAPDMNKFVVQQKINDQSVTAITPTAIQWDPATHTAALTVPIIPASSEEQSVMYRFSYDNGPTVESEPFVIAAEGGIQNLIRNSSFESGESNDLSILPNWWYWGANADDPGKRTTEIKRTGSYSFSTGAPSHAGLVQDIPLIGAGVYKAVLYYYVPEGSTTEGTLQLWGTVMDQIGGSNLTTIVSPVTSVSSALNGQWVKFEYEFQIHSDYQGVEPNNLNLTIIVKDFVTGEELYIDDISIYKLD